MEPDMDTPNNGTGWTQKEMLVRIDAKVDVIANKQNHIDVEIALLKARADECERRVKDGTGESERWRDEVRERIDHIDEEAEEIRVKQRVTAYAVAVVLVLTNIAAPIALRHFF